MPASVEIARLRQAIEQFTARPPRDLPDGVLERLQEVGNALGTHNPSGRGDSPGARETAKAAGTDATGVDYRHAGRGSDQPSPGQSAASDAAKQLTPSEQMEKLAGAVVEKLKASGREGTDRERAGSSTE
jgi:hypothetical protein